MADGAGEFAPLTPELLRQAHKDWFSGGLCAEVGVAVVRTLPLEMQEGREADLLWKQARASLERLYVASEGPWETDDEGFLKRFGNPCCDDDILRRLGSEARRACLRRMADWLEARNG